MDFSDPLSITRMTGIMKKVDRKPATNTWIFIEVFPKSVWLLVGFSFMISLVIPLVFDVMANGSNFMTLEYWKESLIDLCLESRVQFSDIRPCTKGT